jgi:hypothetical protein
MVVYAINALLCTIAVAVLAPLSKVLKDDGAPDFVSLVPLVISGLFFFGMLYNTYKMLRAGKVSE